MAIISNEKVLAIGRGKLSEKVGLCVLQTFFLRVELPSFVPLQHPNNASGDQHYCTNCR